MTPILSFPNLVPFQPAGWQAPLVVSSESAVFLDLAALGGGPLLTNQVAYVHWAIKNDSPVPFHEDFQIGILVDGELVLTFIVPGLGAGEDARRLSGVFTVPTPGEHTVSLIIDFDFRVPETNEFDNRYPAKYVWGQPAPTLVVAQPTPIPTPTAVVIPTSTPTPTPTATATATPIPSVPALLGDERFGVVILAPQSLEEREYYLKQLGVKWYLDFGLHESQVPAGAEYVPYISVPGVQAVWASGQAESVASLTDDQATALGFSNPSIVRQAAKQAPGSYWYMFGEPNRRGYITGTKFVPVFHYYMTQIREADPTAKIIGPSMLNWDWTCFELCVYPQGAAWLQEFIGAYETKYGEKPPVDAWAIDLYPIDWKNTPNNDPNPAIQPTWKGQKVLHSEIVTDQLQGMRQYLDSAGYATTPIWVTEIAIHVGYDTWKFVTATQLAPVGSYHWDNMGNYMVQVLDWLETNGAANKIEKWFFFTPWKDIVNVGGDGYMGTILFSPPGGVGASLNCLGELYRSRALQYLETPPVKVTCDAAGGSVAE